MEANKRNELLEFLIELRDDRDELDKKLKAVKQEVADIESELIADMLESEDASFNHKGVTCSLVQKESASPEEGCKYELYDALKKQSEILKAKGLNGYDDLFTINPSTLSATIKELKKNNNDQLPAWLDGLVRIFEKPSIRLSKGKKVK